MDWHSYVGRLRENVREAEERLALIKRLNTHFMRKDEGQEWTDMTAETIGNLERDIDLFKELISTVEATYLNTAPFIPE